MIELDPLDQICATFGALTSGGVEGMDAEGLERAAVISRRLRELADRVEVHALGALDESQASLQRHGTPTGNWFAIEAGLAPAAAHAQVKNARLLTRHLPDTDQGWADGELTRSHIDVMVRAANPRIRTQITAAERDLLALVEGRTFATWKGAVADVADAFDQDGPDPADPASTSATWVRSGEFAELKARFGGCDVEVLEQIIEAKTSTLFRSMVKERKKNPELPDLARSELRGQAIKALLLEGAGLGTGRTRIGINLVLRSNPKSGPTIVNGLPTLHPETPVDAGWPVFGSLSDVTWSLSNLNGDHLVLEHFAQLLCDCDVHPMLVDADGNPLKLGRTVHITPPKLRRAVLIRDGGCAHPGCDCLVTWVDIHHVTPFEDGGTTDIENLVALCRRHHGLAHRKGWSLTAVGDGWFWWTTPTGRGYWSQRHGKQRAGPAPPHLRLVA